MNTHGNPYELSLAHKAIFSVSDAAGVQVICHTGSLWITLDDDPRDIVLDPGESFFTTEHRQAIIYALEASSLRLEMTQPVVRPASAARARPAPKVSFALAQAA